MRHSPIRLEWDLPEDKEDVLSIREKIASSGILQLFTGGEKDNCVSVTKDNFDDIPDLIDKAISKSAKKFVINNFNCWRCRKEDVVFPIEKKRLERFKEKVSKKIKFWEKNIELVIRDFFISSIFYPVGAVSNGMYNGCQAGAAVAYIRQDGKVYGCSSIDIELGNIKTESLVEIWKNKAGILRKQVSLLPEKCVKCKLVGWCQGGCRGRSYFYYGNFDNPDPMCPHEQNSKP